MLYPSRRSIIIIDLKMLRFFSKFLTIPKNSFYNTLKLYNVIEKNLKNKILPFVNGSINCLQNDVFLMSIASKLIKFSIIGVGGFCMGHGYFVLPKGGCYQKGGDAWYTIYNKKIMV